MVAGGRSSADDAWRWSPWGVAPDAIPGRDVDPDAVRAAAAELTVAGRQVRDTGAEVRRTWHGLGPHYEAPEAPRLLAAMDPVERDTREVGDGVEIVTAALRRYADEVEPLIARLTALRREAWAVDDVVRRRADWRADPELVARAASVRGNVAVAVTALAEAEGRCAAAIRAASGPPPACVPASVVTAAPRSWWGPIIGDRESCARSAAGHVKSFLDGVIIDGLIGGYLGTAALAGLTLDGFSRETAEAAWSGVFDLATPGSVIWMLRRPDPSVTRDAWGGMVEGLVAADQWQENPARATGAVLFTLGTAFLPGGGLKSAATAASAAARTAGRTARVADDVAAEAAQAGAEGWAKRLEAGAAKVPEEWGPGIPNNTGVGWRWHDPTDGGTGVRIDEGYPRAHYESQRVDHVIVRNRGKVLGRDGEPIAGSIKSDWRCHIPLDDWLTWKEWNKPV